MNEAFEKWMAEKSFGQRLQIRRADAEKAWMASAAAERTALIEILREAGCVCILTGKRELGDWRWITDDLAAVRPYWKLVDHHSSCPVALLAAIEARRGKEGR